MRAFTVALLLALAVALADAAPPADCGLCFASCDPGTCSPKTADQCCDNVGDCRTEGCCGYACTSNNDCIDKSGDCGRCKRQPQ